MAFYDLAKIQQLSLAFSKTLHEFQAAAQKSPEVLHQFFGHNMLSFYVDSLGYIDIMNLHGSLLKSMDAVGYKSRQAEFKKVLNQVVLEKVSLFADSNESLGHLSFFFPRISTDLDYVKRFTGYYSKIPVTKKYGWDVFNQVFWNQSIQHADDFWVSQLQKWSKGETVYIDADMNPELTDYYLFLYLDMMPIKWTKTGQYEKLAAYAKLLRKLQRTSNDLTRHIRYTESLLSNPPK